MQRIVLRREVRCLSLLPGELPLPEKYPVTRDAGVQGYKVYLVQSDGAGRLLRDGAIH